MTGSHPYRSRESLRARQPQTYHHLALLAGCVDTTDPTTLQCPLSLEKDEYARHYQYAELHRKLVRAARDHERHSLLLDEVLRELLPSALRCRPEEYEGMCVGVPDAQFLLKRFWRTPQRLTGIPISIETGRTLWQQIKDASWHESYIIPEARDTLKSNPALAETEVMAFLTDLINRPWYFFYVTNIFDTNSAVLLLHITHDLANASTDLADHILRYVDILAELITQHDDLTGLKTFVPQESPHLARSVDSGQKMSDDVFEALKASGDFDYEDPKSERQACEIVRFFLYTAWSRSVTLLFYLVVGQQLEHGASNRWSRYFAVQGLEKLEDLGNLGQGAPVYSAGLAPKYLCGWALELLRRSRAALCLDFRTLLRRYSEQFPDHPGRCNPDSSEPCEGDDPSSCGRFTHATTAPQTAHPPTCDRGACHRIAWDERSYLSITGPRAVLLDSSSPTNPRRLLYTSASDRTMAISHVWAHGQGGRPETGINACQHARYSALARGHGCSSYWIDSACIPSETRLRREAIGQINRIFGQSRVVLISDRDLEQIPLQDAEDDVTWKAQIVVSALLVCDWNVRAWTLLEAFRGSRATRILCAGDETVSLAEVLKLVWRLGPVDLAVLIGSVQHLLPFAEGEDRKSVEEGAQLLSQRHASRPGDEVVIWGLLNMRPGSGDAVGFWKSTAEVNTAFLVSSAPRIRGADGRRVPGFSWAPATPTFPPQSRQVGTGGGRMQTYSVRYPVYDGDGSYVGRIGSEGLQAIWSYMDFNQVALDRHREFFGEVIHPFEDWGLDDADPEEVIVENPDSVSLCNDAQSALDMGRLVRLIQPASMDGRDPYQATKNRGDVSGPCAVMITSADNGSSWEWHDTYSQLDQSYWSWQRGGVLIV